MLHHLQHGVIDMEGYVPWGSNYTFICTMSCEDLIFQAVYKPRRGERPLWDFPTGTLCLRERAAYLVSDAMGLNIVPPTILRDGPHGWGSVQAFIDHDPNENYFTFKETFGDQIRQIALFDLIINNADRKGGHVIRDYGDRLWAIDHGITFHDEPKLRTVIWDFAGESLTGTELATLHRFLTLLESDRTLGSELADHLSPRELNALTGRTEKLIHLSKFPHPGPGRPYPWPMV